VFDRLIRDYGTTRLKHKHSVEILRESGVQYRDLIMQDSRVLSMVIDLRYPKSLESLAELSKGKLFFCVASKVLQGGGHVFIMENGAYIDNNWNMGLSPNDPNLGKIFGPDTTLSVILDIA